VELEEKEVAGREGAEGARPARLPEIDLLRRVGPAEEPEPLVVGDADEELHPHDGSDPGSPAESVRFDWGAVTGGWKVADGREMAKGATAFSDCVAVGASCRSGNRIARGRPIKAGGLLAHICIRLDVRIQSDT
jgi:hypothetical protein